MFADIAECKDGKCFAEEKWDVGLKINVEMWDVAELEE